VNEVLEHLGARPPHDAGSLFVDGTVGLGGHAEAVLEARGDATLLGLDRDPEALGRAAERLGRFGARVRLVHASYADLGDVLARERLGAPAAVLLDLGVSSMQLDDPSRGFSFRAGDAPPDMRFDRTEDAPTALDLVNVLDEETLAALLREHGGEPRARAVARSLVRARPLRTLGELADAVRRAALVTRRLDPATRSFQALRIAVNREMEHLERGLAAAFGATTPRGRVVVISFHSGEDRRVKEAMRAAAREGRARLLTRKPIRPTEEEVRGNPRARPARLRAVEMTTGGTGREG
jgi:16S rRNA (cytosine1402-N4)-methyltransferase